ncbi:MAG: PRD domain-containing protein, partial [Lactococcus sp.]|nr:PRD domain-containing protein [Lactococcus sp.]
MQISKILNNNVVITEKDQAEVVAMGRGLAFGKKIGDQIAVDKIEKFYTLKGDESSRVDELLAGIPDDIFLITDKVITLAKEKIPGKINDSLFLSLADHINATQLRAQEGFVIKNFLLWDIKRFFPTEFALASGQPTSLLVGSGSVSFAQTGAVLAVLLKTKNMKLKELSIPAFISGIFGVTEPAIYGITLPKKKPFWASCIVGA